MGNLDRRLSKLESDAGLHPSYRRMLQGISDEELDIIIGIRLKGSAALTPEESALLPLAEALSAAFSKEPSRESRMPEAELNARIWEMLSKFEKEYSPKSR